MQKNPNIVELKDSEGNLTGHLIGIFNRTTFLLENRIKPIWVFDGKPPEAKFKETRKRLDRRDEAIEAKAKAKEEGDAEAVKKAAGSATIITKSMHQDAVKLC